MKKQTIYTVNAKGLNEIEGFLLRNHIRIGEYISPGMLQAWAEEAEFQFAEGNPASVEIPARNSINGCTQEFTISNAGLDAKTVEIDE